MPALDAFRQNWPDVALDLSAAFSFAPLPALVRGDLDVVITSDPQSMDAVQYLPLFSYELVLAVASSNPLAKHRFIDPGQLADQVRSEEHTSELQSLMRISYAVFCLKKKKHQI